MGENPGGAVKLFVVPRLSRRSSLGRLSRGSDDDRLIKLAFFQKQWDKVVARFAQASFNRRTLPRILGTLVPRQWSQQNTPS